MVHNLFSPKKLLIWLLITVNSFLFLILLKPIYSPPIISLLPSGFSPPELTIKKGETVTFITKRGKPFWPASNVHPLHSLYPEFDPKKPIEANQSWSFTFDKAGKWKYHDHTAPYFRGVIIVRGQDSTVSFVDPCQTKIEKITDANIRLQCWSDQIEQVLKSKGLDQSLELLASLYESQPDFAVNCHDVSHSLGDAAYKLFAQGKTVTFSPKTTYCGYGFYHGLMEALLYTKGDYKQAREFCQNINKSMTKDIKNPQTIYSCYHGIGHGTLDITDLSIWGNEEKMVSNALKVCEAVGYTKEERQLCGSGVFNALQIAYNTRQYKLNMKKEDPFGICRKQPEIYKKACYREISIVYLSLTQSSFSQMANYIETKIDDETGANAAIYANASEAIRRVIDKEDHSELIRTCKSLRDKLRIWCIQGLSEGNLSWGKPGREYIKGLAFCKSSLFNEEERMTCYTYILPRLGIFYSSQKIDEICSTLEEKYKKLCYDPNAIQSTL